jgi:hypothetical protein
MIGRDALTDVTVAVLPVEPFLLPVGHCECRGGVGSGSGGSEGEVVEHR